MKTMQNTFTHAITRQPGANFAGGLTSQELGPPDVDLALNQHIAYVAALRRCGVEVDTLEPDQAHPDATFVEDAAVLVPAVAILARPGAPSREGEVKGIEQALLPYYRRFAQITSPGTMEGGDICEAGDTFFIGISQRTNEEGARQLSGFLASEGYRCEFVDARPVPGILHLKSGVAYLGENTLAVIPALEDHPAFAAYRRIVTAPQETYAANCIRVNNYVLAAAGFPRFTEALVQAGFQPLLLEMSEYRKMDGGLSCLSLRF
jgi:dimethylargininase